MQVSLVFFDLDGVMASFDEHYDRLIGVRKPDGDVRWDLVQNVSDFFENMPLMPRALELWNTAPREIRRVLSSIPKSIAVSGIQKKMFVVRNLDNSMPDEHIHLVRGKSLKKAFAAPGHVLVDDWEPNIVDWREAGGIGIHYRDAGQAIEELAEAMAIRSPARAVEVSA